MQRDRRALLAFELVLFLILLWTLVWNLTSNWRFYPALMPMVFSTFGTLATGAVLLRDWLWPPPDPERSELDDPSVSETLPTALMFFAWMIGTHVLVLLIGFLPAVMLACVAYMAIFGRIRLVPAVCALGVLFIVTWGIYDQFLHTSWPHAWLF